MRTFDPGSNLPSTLITFQNLQEEQMNRECS